MEKGKPAKVWTNVHVQVKHCVWGVFLDGSLSTFSVLAVANVHLAMKCEGKKKKRERGYLWIWILGRAN